MNEEIKIAALQSKISLLKKCVEFYADKNNYGKTLNNSKSQIDLDEGHIANHTLKTFDELNALEESTLKTFENFQRLADENPERVMELLKEMMNKKDFK